MKVTKTLTKHSDINIGDKVEVISEVVDFNFFKEGTVGTVIKKGDDYLGIIVRFKDGNTFNFNPENLKVIKTITNIPDTKQKLLEEFENKVATFTTSKNLRFGSVTVAFNEEDLIGPCLELLDVEKKVVIISNKTFQGNVLPRDKTEEIALQKGAIVIRVDISDQYAMRNIGISLLQGMGIDYVFLVDSDEWFSYLAMRNIKERIRKTKKDGYRVRLVHLIKKPNYQAITSRDGGTLECIKSDKRLETRDPHWWHGYYDYEVDRFPEGLGEVYHLSWVRRPEKIKEKIKNFSHAKEMRDNWFEEVWQKFTPDMKNFGPTRPTDFTECKVIELPQEIKEKIPKHLW